jgi:hypothetical protein
MVVWLQTEHLRVDKALQVSFKASLYNRSNWLLVLDGNRAVAGPNSAAPMYVL